MFGKTKHLFENESITETIEYKTDEFSTKVLKYGNKKLPNNWKYKHIKG